MHTPGRPTCHQRRTASNMANMACICWLVLLIGIGWLGIPRSSWAAEPATARVIVTIRDAGGHGVAAVEVHILADTHHLATATTDATGTAVFDRLPQTTVQVVVHGRLASGTPLIQRGADAAGIQLFVQPQTRLDLRVEPDGTLIPDPVTMFSQEQTSAVADLPSTAMGTPAAVMGIPTAVPFAAVAPQPAPPRAPVFVPWGGIVSMAIITGIMLVIGWRMRGRR